MRAFIVGTFLGSVSGATLVALFLALFSKQADEWERRQVVKYHVNFPGTPLPQRTLGGVTSHVVVDWSDDPAT